MDLVQLGAQYGFPALLVCFLLWTQHKRDHARDETAAKTAEFIQNALLEQVNKTTEALAENSAVLARLCAALESNTANTDTTGEKLDRLLFLFEQHKCPLAKNGPAPDPPDPPHIHDPNPAA